MDAIVMNAIVMDACHWTKAVMDAIMDAIAIMDTI